MKHCAECKFSNYWYNEGEGKGVCFKLDIHLKPEDIDERNHCWLEDAQEYAEELFPELWKEAIDACPCFKVEVGRGCWLDDEDLLMEMLHYEVGQEKSEKMIAWLNE